MIDPHYLKPLLNDICEIAKNLRAEDYKDQTEIAKLLYQLESELFKIKTAFNLPDLDNSICSKSVTESFNRMNESTLLRTNKPKFSNYFRQNDYQYWLLIFLLRKNNEIREKKLSLYQIIDQFIEHYKDESFFLEDIERTPSGATRCRTNLRFAYNELKHIGLVRLYDKKYKNSWSLTYIGFFIAASFCLDSMDIDDEPLLNKATRFNESTWYFNINKNIVNRIQKLSEVDYFISIIDTIKIDSLDLKELEKGYKIYQQYYTFLLDLRKLESKNKAGLLKEYLDKLEETFMLDKYMTELSTRFDAQAYFEQLIYSMENHVE